MTAGKLASGPRRWWLLAGLLVAVGLIVWGVLAGTAAGDDESSPGPTSSASASASPGSPASTPTGAASTNAPTSTPDSPESAAPIPPERPAAAIDAEVADDSGVTLSLSKVEVVDGEASAPGEISGPAIRVTVEVENGSDDRLSLRYATVNAYYGPDRTPAPPIMQPGGAPLRGDVKAGATARGVYLFSIPSSAHDDVKIGVDYLPGQPTAVFEGSVD